MFVFQVISAETLLTLVTATAEILGPLLVVRVYPEDDAVLEEESVENTL